MNKKFAYKLTPLLWVLFIAGLIVAGACIVLNINRFISLLSEETAGIYNFIGSILSAVIGVIAFVFIVPAMISSNYVVTDKHLICKWGLVYNKYEVKDITTVTHFRISNKLVVYFEDQSYTTVNIAPEEYDNFVDELKKVNKKIFYQLNTENKGEK